MVRNSETVQSLLIVLGIMFCTERSMTQDVVRNLVWLAESFGDRGK
jgi:hypothetical protein